MLHMSPDARNAYCWSVWASREFTAKPYLDALRAAFATLQRAPARMPRCS